MNAKRLVPDRIENMIVHTINSGKNLFTWNGFSVDLRKELDRKYCREVLEISLKQYRVGIYYGSNTKETLEKCLQSLQ